MKKLVLAMTLLSSMTSTFAFSPSLEKASDLELAKEVLVRGLVVSADKIAVLKAECKGSTLEFVNSKEEQEGQKLQLHMNSTNACKKSLKVVKNKLGEYYDSKTAYTCTGSSLVKLEIDSSLAMTKENSLQVGVNCLDAAKELNVE